MRPEPLFSEVLIEAGPLRLRAPAGPDLEFLFSLYSDPAVTRYLDAHPHRSPADTKKFLEATAHRKAAREGVFLIVEWDGAPAGIIRITGINEKHRFASVGYELKPAFWHKGIMTHAMRELQQFLFSKTNLCRLEAQTHTENLRSVKLLERCGFMREGRMRGNFSISGRMEDSFLYSILAGEISPVQ